MDIISDELRILNLKKLNKRQPLELNVQEIDLVRYTPPYLKPAKKDMKSPINIEQMIKKFNTDHWDLNDIEQEKCSTILRNVNFYTFKYYAKKEHATNFNSTLIIYIFDKFLQNQLQRIILDIEMGLRTIIVESLSIYYVKNHIEDVQPSQFYLDPHLYYTETGRHVRKKQREKKVNAILATFGDTIYNNRDQPIVKKELDEYESISAWVLFDYLTLGELSQFFGMLTTANKKRVADFLNDTNTLKDNRITGQLLSSWINAIRYLRNKVSHGSKIYGEHFNILAESHTGDKDYIYNIDESYRNHLVNTMLACRRIVACMSINTQCLWNETLTNINNEINKHPIIKANRLGLNQGWLNYFQLNSQRKKNNIRKWKSK